jgi:S-(hydroxymethyl)glutathione dehydrogenase / alcohol dehydrogenase
MLKGRFAILVKPKKKLIISELNIPKLKKNQLLIKIKYSGICRSQIMEIDGQRGVDKFLPHTLGHEASGVIIDKYKSIKNFKKKDKVIITWIKSKKDDCEKIYYLMGGTKINSGYANTFSTYAIISLNRCIKKPKKLSMINAALYGCAVPTGAGMVLNAKKLKKDSKIIIIGFGGIGFFIFLTLKSKGIKNIIVIDKNQDRLHIAKNVGVKYLLKKIDQKKIKNIFDADADFCFETAGIVSTIEKGFKVIKSNGCLIFASHPGKGKKISIDPHQLIKGKKIYGTWGGNINLEKNIDKLVKILNVYKKEFKILTKNTYSLNNINNTIKNFKRGKILRPIIKL